MPSLQAGVRAKQPPDITPGASVPLGVPWRRRQPEATFELLAYNGDSGLLHPAFKGAAASPAGDVLAKVFYNAVEWYLGLELLLRLRGDDAVDLRQRKVVLLG